MNGEKFAVIIVILFGTGDLYFDFFKLTYRYISANIMLTCVYVMMASLFLLV